MPSYSSLSRSLVARRGGSSARMLKAGGGPIGLSRNNAMLQMDIFGANELEAALRQLAADAGSRTMKRTMEKALMKAGQPVVDAAQRLAPRGKERGKPHMADKIRISTTLSRRQRRLQGFGNRWDGVAKVYIGTGPRGPGVLTEFGTGPRRWKNGKFTGAAPAQPFMRPAWEANKHQVLRDFAKLLWIEIERAAKRAARRKARGTQGKRRRR